jgi:tRNA threonylcarbamoyladenosine biosynthesis protein TsaB
MKPVATLLAFDTSTEQMAVTVLHAGGALARNAPGGAAASAGLLPCALGLMGQLDLPLARLNAVAFGAGPGAFTGLRTSCAVAQGLAFGLGCPLLAIDSLLIVAEDARAQAGVAADEVFDVAVAMDARMDEAYAARYLHTAAGWRTLEAPRLTDLPALKAAASAERAAFWRAGSAWAAFGERIGASPGSSQFDHELDRAAALGRLAALAWAAGAAIDPAVALPTYLCEKVAQTTAERQTARDAAAALVPEAAPRSTP